MPLIWKESSLSVLYCISFIGKQLNADFLLGFRQKSTAQFRVLMLRDCYTLERKRDKFDLILTM